MMQTKGIPNYYGYQRFGEDGESYKQGKELALSGKKLKGSREKLLVSAYQSFLFNQWLTQRVKISHTITHFSIKEATKKLRYPAPLVEVLKKQTPLFKLFLGDVVMPYPYGKFSMVKDMQEASQRFEQKAISPTGLLCGDNALRSQSDARHLEEPFDDDELNTLRGDRRFAWIWPKEVETSYEESSQKLTLSFYLPKGSFATTFLEEIGKTPLKQRR